MYLIISIVLMLLGTAVFCYGMKLRRTAEEKALPKVFIATGLLVLAVGGVLLFLLLSGLVALPLAP